jgi:hypothetical protein
MTDMLSTGRVERCFACGAPAGNVGDDLTCTVGCCVKGYRDWWRTGKPTAFAPGLKDSGQRWAPLGRRP